MKSKAATLLRTFGRLGHHAGPLQVLRAGAEQVGLIDRIPVQALPLPPSLIAPYLH